MAMKVGIHVLRAATLHAMASELKVCKTELKKKKVTMFAYKNAWNVHMNECTRLATSLYRGQGMLIALIACTLRLKYYFRS